MTFIVINGKKQAFSIKRIKRMYDTLELIKRGLDNGHIKNASLIHHVEGAKSLPIESLDSIVNKSLKP